MTLDKFKFRITLDIICQYLLKLIVMESGIMIGYT